MRTLGFDKPLYILPFDHRGSFVTKMFGWHGTLTGEQTAEIAATKQVIYDGFKAAITAGVPKVKAGILVDEQFGGAILRDAAANGRRDGRDKVGCIILGRGEDDKKVREWLTTAAGVKGFIGFAVGRTDFLEPLLNLLARKTPREAAVTEIGRRYREFVSIFEKAQRS